MAVRVRLKLLASTGGSSSGGGGSNSSGGSDRRVDSTVTTPSSSSIPIESVLEALWCSISTAIHPDATTATTSTNTSTTNNNSSTTPVSDDAKAKSIILFSKSFSAPFLTLHKQLLKLSQPSTKISRPIDGDGHHGEESVCVHDVAAAVGDVTISVLRVLNSVCGHMNGSSNVRSNGDSGTGTGINIGIGSNGGTNSTGTPIVSSLISILRAMGNCLSATPTTITVAMNTSNSGIDFLYSINTPYQHD